MALVLNLIIFDCVGDDTYGLPKFTLISNFQCSVQINTVYIVSRCHFEILILFYYILLYLTVI